MDLSRFTWIDNIDRRSGLTVDQFISQYERPMRPVILTDIVHTWPAATEWTREKLLSKYGDTIYKVGAYRMTMRNYLAYSAQAREETPLYLFDNAYPQNTPEFAKQVSERKEGVVHHAALHVSCLIKDHACMDHASCVACRVSCILSSVMCDV